MFGTRVAITLSVYTIQIIAFNINLLAFIIKMIQICPNWKFHSMHTTLAEAFAQISILSWKNLKVLAPSRLRDEILINFYTWLVEPTYNLKATFSANKSMLRWQHFRESVLADLSQLDCICGFLI